MSNNIRLLLRHQLNRVIKIVRIYSAKLIYIFAVAVQQAPDLLKYWNNDAKRSKVDLMKDVIGKKIDVCVLLLFALLHVDNIY